MSIFEGLRPLSDIVDLDSWPDDLLAGAAGDFLERIRILELHSAQTPLGTLFAASVVVEEGITLRFSSLPFLSLVLAEASPGAPATVNLLLEDEWSLEVRDIPIALRLENSLLRPVGAAQDHPELTLQGGLHLDREGVSLVHPSVALSLPPCEIGHTGIVVAIDHMALVLTEDDVPDIAYYYGYDESFRGIHAESATITFLPTVRVGAANGLVIEGSELLISQHGLTSEVHLEFPLLDDGIHILPASELTGQLFSENWPFALKSLDVDLVDNLPLAFQAAGALRIPIFDMLFDLTFGIAAATEDTGFHYTAAIRSRTPHHIDTIYGTISYQDLSLEGQLGGETLALQGILAGLVIDLAPLQLDAGTAFVQVRQEQHLHEVRLQLTDVDLGPLGTVDLADLLIVDKEEGGQTKRSVHLEAEFAWQDFRQRLNLDQLPDQFPLPPDDAQVSVFLSWEDNGAGGYTLVLRFAAELSDLGEVWSFIPEDFRPEVRNVRFTFEATYASAAAFQNASTSDTFSGNVAVEMELRLPQFPNVPGAELFDVDREQWIEASLKGGVRSVNGANEGYMEMAIANAPTVKVNFPGLPQAEPPIQIKINKVDFDLKTQPGADSLTGRLSLDGDFLLRPINPAETNLPVPPAMAVHMEKLFKAAGLSTVGGKAKFDMQFKGDKAAIALGIAFDQAKLELDLFDMIAGLARGMAPPQGINGSANSIDLDLDIDIRLREINIQFGSIEESATTDQSHFGFDLALDATVAGVQVDGFSFKLSGQEFSFGFGSLAVPIELPHFPISVTDLNQLRDGTGAWDYEMLWLQDREPQLASSIRQLKNDIEALKGQLTTATGDIEASLSAALRAKRKTLFENSARKFLIESILAVHQVVGPPNRSGYQAMVEAYMALMDATLHQFSFDTKLDFVLRDVRFVLPFQNPTDIRVEGGAQLAGFKPDDPMAPLGDLVFKLGLSAEYMYFNVEGGEPIPLPVFGHYRNEANEEEAKISLKLNHARIGYGYSKNALVVSFAGELKIAKPLADDLNTADTIGIGVRVPERSRLGFKLDLIPIVLGEVDFLLPLFEFDLDLRKEFSPGILDSATCEPFWDGLQLIAPHLIRQDFKRLRFAPFFGSLFAPNYNLSFDLMLGDAHNGLTHVCHDYLVILPTSLFTTIPMLTDGTPFFNNLCTHVRLAGFGVNFDLQRPFPSLSPLALFEIFGLLADPMMPIDPDGALAGTIRATIQHARITLPPAVVRMFPEHGAVLTREVHYTINLGTLITLTQAIAGPVGQILTNAQQTTGDIAHWLEATKADPPAMSPSTLLALLPPELRRFDLEGSFVGFDASASFVLLTPEEAAAAFAHRDAPVNGVPTTAPQYGEYADPAWLTAYQPNFSKPAVPLYNPADPANSLLKSAPFDTFDAASLAELQTPAATASGVLVGAEVKVLDDQAFRFLGYLFTDGTFSLISTLDLTPLRLAVAGITITLPLEIHGRLALSGRAQGATSFSNVSAQVWGTWEPLPDLIQLHAGSKNAPVSLVLQSNGRFVVKGSGGLQLFGGAATVTGEVDISHTHCFIKGTFTYTSLNKIGNEHILELGLMSAGRIGPGSRFELSGVGNLKILGKTITNVKGLISDKGVAVEAKFNTTNWNWNGITISEFTMALRGMIALSPSGPPNFLLDGDTYLRLFGNRNSVNRLEISGRGGIRAEGVDLATFVEGKLFWQGREWLQGRILLHSETGIHIEGHTHFGLLLSPGTVGSVKVASLFFRINLGGTVNISPTGAFECDLGLDWDLGINLPGNTKQTLPIASNSVRLTGSLNNPIELINLEGFKLLPLQGFEISLPIPQIKGKGNPVLKIGMKNNKVAINVPTLGTIYIDEKEFVTGLTGGSSPSLVGGTLPSLNGGTLPSLDKGELPSLDKGTRPTLSINFSPPPSFEFNRGTSPSLDKGKLPNLTPGTFPSLDPGTLPTFTTGSFPTLSKSKIPIPSYKSGEQFDADSKPALIYKDYTLSWENETISIGWDAFKHLPIRFGVDEQSYRFYIQIDQNKYDLSGSVMR